MGVWENGGADKYNRDADFLSYKQKVWEVNHPGQPFRMAAAGGKPSNNNMDLDEPEEEGNEEEENEEEVDEEEEDLVMIDQQLNFQCPLTVSYYRSWQRKRMYDIHRNHHKFIYFFLETNHEGTLHLQSLRSFLL